MRKQKIVRRIATPFRGSGRPLLKPLPPQLNPAMAQHRVGVIDATHKGWMNPGQLREGGPNVLPQYAGLLKSAVPSYKKGGIVKKTGLAKVHKGERVLTKKQAKKFDEKKYERSRKKVFGLK